MKKYIRKEGTKSQIRECMAWPLANAIAVTTANGATKRYAPGDFLFLYPWDGAFKTAFATTAEFDAHFTPGETIATPASVDDLFETFIAGASHVEEPRAMATSTPNQTAQMRSNNKAHNQHDAKNVLDNVRKQVNLFDGGIS